MGVFRWVVLCAVVVGGFYGALWLFKVVEWAYLTVPVFAGFMFWVALQVLRWEHRYEE